ncbi:MAG TPA: site-2 protease family protein [Dehalococcoidia bacterium]|nr:site-2 protease family protein [Dehalococcoidia bacterium]
MNRLSYDPLGFFLLLSVRVVAVAVAIAVHEGSHALVADRQGDPTPRSLGRLTLNPIAHLDPLGTLLLFLVGFGWGKPVPVNVANFRGRPLAAMARVGFAGPLAGLITAGVLSIPLRFLDLPVDNDFFVTLFGTLFAFNIILSVFNLIPIPPLDGFHVLLGLVPSRTALSLTRYESYGPPVLILLILLDNFTGMHFLGRALGPAVNFFSRLYLGGDIF